MLTVEVSTVKKRLKIQCPDQIPHDFLNFIAARPIIEGWEPETECVRLQRFEGFYRLPLTKNYTTEGDLSHVLSDLHTWHFLKSRSEFPDAPMLHAGSFVINGKMVLVFGDKGAGKSTLMVWLGHRGLEICGDEHVLLQGSKGLTRPRTLRLKQSSLKLLPGDIRVAVEQRPIIEDWHGRKIYAVSPEIFGRPWNIRTLPIGAIFVLKPNHGGFSHVKPVNEDDIMQRVLDNTLLPDGDRMGGLIGVRHLLGSVPLFELTCGKLDRASSIVYDIVAT